MSRTFIRINVVVATEDGGECTSQVYYELAVGNPKPVELSRLLAKELKTHLDPALMEVGDRKRFILSVDGKAEAEGNGVDVP